MLWTICALAYIVLNMVGIVVFHKLLKSRLANPLLAWLFSISLSLSLSFPLALLALNLFINSIRP